MHDKHNARVVVDSAFNTSDFPCLAKSAQVDPIKTAAGLSSNRQAMLLTQLSEWGMRMIQAQLPRMKEQILFEEQGQRRRLVQHLMVLLCDFQTSTILTNQMLNVRMSHNQGFLSCERSLSNHATNLLEKRQLPKVSQSSCSPK